MREAAYVDECVGRSLSYENNGAPCACRVCRACGIGVCVRARVGGCVGACVGRLVVLVLRVGVEAASGVGLPAASEAVARHAATCPRITLFSASVYGAARAPQYHGKGAAGG